MAELKPKVTPAKAGVSENERLLQEALAQAQASLNDIHADADADDAAPRAAREADDDAGAANLELLSDVDLHVSIELGRTQMLVEDVLKLNEGSVVELDKLAGDPVDVYVNRRLVARGEVLVLNDTFCIRISEIVGNLEEQAEAAASDARSRSDLTQAELMKRAVPGRRM